MALRTPDVPPDRWSRGGDGAPRLRPIADGHARRPCGARIPARRSRSGVRGTGGTRGSCHGAVRHRSPAGDQLAPLGNRHPPPRQPQARSAAPCALACAAVHPVGQRPRAVRGRARRSRDMAGIHPPGADTDGGRKGASHASGRGCTLGFGDHTGGTGRTALPLRYIDAGDWGLANIEEWQSPSFHDPAHWPFLALIVLVGLNGGRRSPGWLVMLSWVGIAMALVALRSGPIAAVFALPVLAIGLEDRMRTWRGPTSAGWSAAQRRRHARAASAGGRRRDPRGCECDPHPVARFSVQARHRGG